MEIKKVQIIITLFKWTSISPILRKQTLTV